MAARAGRARSVNLGFTLLGTVGKVRLGLKLFDTRLLFRELGRVFRL